MNRVFRKRQEERKGRKSHEGTRRSVEAKGAKVRKVQGWCVEGLWVGAGLGWVLGAVERRPTPPPRDARKKK